MSGLWSLRFLRDTRGTSAIEFAGAATLFVGLLANAVDFNDYEYRSMQIVDAAQVSAQTAWPKCNSASSLPATQNCSGLNAAVTTAIQSTALGSRVSLATGYPTEGYYCVNTKGALQLVGSLSSKPSNCSAAGNAATSPSDYVQIQVSAPYTPLFPGLTVVGNWGVTSLSSVSWMRLQ